MNKWMVVLTMVALCVPVVGGAEEFKIEKISSAAPDVDQQIKAKLSDAGYKISKANGTPWCELWLVKQATMAANFKPSNEILYPFEQGSLVGVVRFPQKGFDIREQEVKAGVYTLRFALQPEDGSHVGTFQSRDFLVMLPAAEDRSAATLADRDKLIADSAKGIDASHPGVMGLLKAETAAIPSAHEVPEDIASHGWAVLVQSADAEGGTIPIKLIIAGKVEH